MMIATEVTRSGRKRHGRIVSLMFPSNWGTTRARAWARHHGFADTFYQVEGGMIHIPQAPVRKGDRIRTVSFGKGIEARIAFRGPRR